MSIALHIAPPTDRASAAHVFQQLQQQALAQGATLRPPPPEPSSCCGRGCNGCVWEGYLAAAVFWHEDALLALRASALGTNTCTAGSV